MRRNEDCRAFFVVVVQLLKQTMLHQRIQSVCGLIQYQKFRIENQTVHNRDFFPITQGKVLHFLFRLQCEAFHVISHHFLDIMNLVEFPRHHQNLFNGKIAVVVHVTRDISDDALQALGVFLGIQSENSGTSFAGR